MMDDKEKGLFTKVFFDLRRMERLAQAAIRKMTVIDKIERGEYKEKEETEEEKEPGEEKKVKTRKNK